MRGVIVLVVLLLAGGGAAWYFLGGSSKSQAKAQATSQVTTATVQLGNIQLSASGSGTLAARQSVDLSFSTSGTVAELKVKLGDQVKTGDVLAKLDNAKDLEAKVASAQLALIEAQQTLTKLQKNANVSLAQAYQDLVTAQETYNTALTTNARADYMRCGQDVTTKYKSALDRAIEKLANTHVETTSSQVYIDAQNDYYTALANYNYCISYTKDEKTGYQASLDVAKNTLQQAQDKYDTLKKASGIDPDELAVNEAKVKAAEIQLSQAQDNLTGITLIAPFDGKVVYLAAGQGNYVTTSKFITVSDVSHPTISISVDETDMDKLVVGGAATVTFDALQDQTFTGKVTQVDPQLTTSGQYKVAKGLVELDEKSAKTIESLPLGLTASVTIVSKQAENVLLVPVKALKSLGNQQYSVTVVGSDGKQTQKTVTVGLNDGTNAEITSGLTEGELVSTGTVQTTTSSSKSSQDQGMPGGDFPGGGMPPAP